MIPSQKMFALLVASLALTTMTLAQSYPTNSVLTRMTMVESRWGRGSAFSVDVDQREYWITAKHILTGAKHPPYGSITERSVSLRMLDPGAQRERWLPENFSVIDAGKDVDIVVLAPSVPLLQNPLSSVSTDFEAMLGGDCTFLGFPEGTGGAWRATLPGGTVYWMPYAKHCFVSSLPTGEPSILVLDGINNPGFSGGPVIYRTGPQQKIIAVVSGYVTEPADVIPSLAVNEPRKTKKLAQPHKATVNLNSGFIIAYVITPAIEAIHKTPIGPLRVADARQ